MVKKVGFPVFELTESYVFKEDSMVLLLDHKAYDSLKRTGDIKARYE
ncbi:hypothetical protein ACFSMW_14265 [Virgibacillus halophilus]